MSDVRVYLTGWDDAERCIAESLSWVPDEHLIYVIRARQRRLGIPERHDVTERSEP